MDVDAKKRIEAIRKRVSVRSFADAPSTVEMKETIRRLTTSHAGRKGPFGHTFRPFFVENVKTTGRIGTYGFIKNAPAFVGGVANKEFLALVDFAHAFEHLMLDLVAEGFGTCWLAETFKRGKISSITNVEGFIPAVSPVGIPARKKSLRERAIAGLARARTRRPPEELFFLSSLDEPLPKGHPLGDVFELVRIAPSGGNRQPWRLFIEEGIIRLYIKKSAVKSLFPVNIGALDAGIALAHLELGLDHLSYSFEYCDDAEAPPKKGMLHVASMKVSGAGL